MNLEHGVKKLSEDIRASQKILTASGDEMRQHLIQVMLQTGDCNGKRVYDIAENTKLSRPAVSHPLQILRDTGIVKMRREGRKNYYYFDAGMEAFDKLIDMRMLACCRFRTGAVTNEEPVFLSKAVGSSLERCKPIPQERWESAEMNATYPTVAGVAMAKMWIPN